MTTKIAQLVKIREDGCIGCTKCISACPVDAIVGSNQVMHTVITSECIGCKLCIEPCPMDCIEEIEQTNVYVIKHSKQRIAARKMRLQSQQIAKRESYKQQASVIDKKAMIAAAIARTKNK